MLRSDAVSVETVKTWSGEGLRPVLPLKGCCQKLCPKDLMTAEGSPASKMKEELVSGGKQTLIWSKDFSGKYI
jgi:hypothetical protein